MPRRDKKARDLIECLRDVTINDFANSSAPRSGGVRKNKINMVKSQVKQLSTAEGGVPCNVKLNYLRSRPVRKKRFQKMSEAVEVETREKKVNPPGKRKYVKRPFRRYPLELWYKISEFITPEDIGTFACICHDTLAVVSSAKFWFNLYERFYKDVPDLPEQLKRECMVRKYGLRANVVRALYYMYPPFVNRLKSDAVHREDPRSLLKRVCVLACSKKMEGKWLFYFKLKECQLRYGRKCSESCKKPGLMELLEDINANDDSDCKILEDSSDMFSDANSPSCRKIINKFAT